MSYDSSAGTADTTAAPDGAAVAPARRLSVAAVIDPAEWADLIARAPAPHLTQSHCYGEAKRAKGWRVSRVRFADGDAVVAFCQVLEFRVLGVRLLSRINRGPIFLADAPSPALVRDVYRTIRSHWGRWYGPLLLAPALEANPAHRELLAGAGFVQRRERGWNSLRVDLSGSEGAIRASFASTFRNRLRAAERSDLTLRIAGDAAAVEWMIARHAENQRSKRFRAADGTFIRALSRAAGGDYLIFQAMLDGVPVAGMSVVRFGRLAEYHTGWFGRDGRKANAGNFLMWAIVREMKRRGCTQFDAGGLYGGHGYTQFKRGLRGTEFSLAGEWFTF